MDINDFPITDLRLADLENREAPTGHYNCEHEGVTFPLLFRLRPGSNLLYVLLSATTPRRYQYPYYSRWSWGAVFPGNTLNIADPTQTQGRGLSVGWYLGNEKRDYIELVKDIVAGFAAKLGVPGNRVIIYGSSAGGFAALRLAFRLPGSLACVLNPQVDLAAYKPGPVTALLKNAFGGKKLEDLPEKVRSRFSLLTDAQNFKNARAVYAQNIRDEFHYENHYKLVRRSALHKRHKFVYQEYEGDGGHVGETRDFAKTLLKKCHSLLKVDFAREDKVALHPRQIYLISPPREPENPQKILFAPAGREGFREIEITPNFNWNSNPFGDENWKSQLQNWRALDGLLLKFYETRDYKWLKPCLNLILSWQKFYAKHKPGEYVWNNMNVGMRLMKAAFVLAWHKFYEFPAVAFDDLIKSHCEFLLAKNKLTWSNHAFVDINGLAAIKRFAGEKLAAEIDAYIDEVFPELLERQFTAAGQHRENSPAYHYFGVCYLCRLRKSGFFDKFKLAPLEKKSRAMLARFVKPDRKFAPLGDTDADHVFDKKITLADGFFNWEGYCAVRRGSSYLLFAASRLSDIHKHSDDLSLIWFEGEDILCDAGKYAYEKSRKSAYAVSTRAHNTLEINGKNTYERGATDNPLPGSYLLEAVREGEVYKIRGEMNLEKFAAKHERQISYRPGAGLDVLDSVMAAQKNSYALYWGFPETARVLAKTKNGVTIGLKSGAQVRATFHSREKIALKIVKGRLFPRLLGWRSPSYGVLVPAYCLIVKTKAQNAKIYSRFKFTPA